MRYKIINKKKYFMGIPSHPLKYQYELATLKYSTTRYIKDIENFIENIIKDDIKRHEFIKNKINPSSFILTHLKEAIRNE